MIVPRLSIGTGCVGTKLAGLIQDQLQWWPDHITSSIKQTKKDIFGTKRKRCKKAGVL
jgi:hypothetical protein